MTLGSGGAAASEMALGGQVSTSARTTESDTLRNSQQLTVTSTLDGAGYYWRPWFITGNFRLNLSHSLTHLERDALGERQESTVDFSSGEAYLTAFPRSRFPLQTFVDVLDSRVETDSVGVALDDINTLRRERIGATQQFRPVDGNSNYSVQVVRTHTLENNLNQENSRDVWATASHELREQSLSYRFNVRDTERDELALRRDENHSAATVRHDYHPAFGLAVESAFDVTKDETRSRPRIPAAGALAEDILGIREQSGTMSSFLTWRPAESQWTLRANVGAQSRERLSNEFNSQSEARNAAVGANYDVTTALHVTGDMGVTRTRTDNTPEIERRFQDIALEYTPEATPLGPVQYHWSARGSYANTDATNEPSVQSQTASLQHGLSRIAADSEGRTLALSIDQAATQAQDSRGTELLTVNYLGSAAVLWTSPSSTSRAQLNANHSHSTGVQQGADARQPVDLTVQTVTMLAGRQWQATRYHAFDGDAATGSVLVVDTHKETRSTFSSASAGYTYRQAFRIDQLRFRSRLEYAVRESRLAAGTSEGEERASWDNRLDYTVGLLNLALRRTITLFNGARTTITVVSASRTF